MSGIPSWARIGAKVVHKLYEPIVTGHRWPGAIYPEESGVYTIRKVVFATEDGAPLVLLVEIRNAPPAGSNLEGGFDLRHFRPLATLETDISTHFRQHLDVRDQVEA